MTKRLHYCFPQDQQRLISYGNPLDLLLIQPFSQSGCFWKHNSKIINEKTSKAFPLCVLCTVCCDRSEPEISTFCCSDIMTANSVCCCSSSKQLKAKTRSGNSSTWFRHSPGLALHGCAGCGGEANASHVSSLDLELVEGSFIQTINLHP